MQKKKQVNSSPSKNPNKKNNTLLACLHDQNKSGFFGWPAFFPANQGFLKNFQIALIGWIKSGPPKSHFWFDHVNRL